MSLPLHYICRGHGGYGVHGLIFVSTVGTSSIILEPLEQDLVRSGALGR
jgi:hypothetical protein